MLLKSFVSVRIQKIVFIYIIYICSYTNIHEVCIQTWYMFVYVQIYTYTNTNLLVYKRSGIFTIQIT